MNYDYKQLRSDVAQYLNNYRNILLSQGAVAARESKKGLQAVIASLSERYGLEIDPNLTNISLQDEGILLSYKSPSNAIVTALLRPDDTAEYCQDATPGITRRHEIRRPLEVGLETTKQPSIPPTP